MCRVDVCRLEALAVVSPFLYVPDGRTEQCRSVFLRNCKQSDFAVELDKFFNDKFANIATTATASVFPGMFEFVGTLHERLSFAGRRHQWFNDTRETYFIGSFFQFFQSCGIEVFGCFQSEFLGGKVANGFAVHREVHGTSAGNYLDTFFLEVV